MKILLPVLCSVLLVGCGDSTKTSTPTSTQTASETIAAPVAATALIPASVTAEASTPVATAALSGEGLFTQKCASCHGTKAEKSALGQSQIIANFSEQQIKDALHGYQAGTYGKAMKGIMQGQAKALSNEDIEALAKYISPL